jgi:inorganic pyrophosphatase
MTRNTGEDPDAYMESVFWRNLDRLAATSRVIIERSKGTPHPGYRNSFYPLDYGFFENTRTVDGGGIDVWDGSTGDKRVVGVVCTLDLKKRDMELKVLLGCTPEEMQIIANIHNSENQSGLLIKRPKQA